MGHCAVLRACMGLGGGVEGGNRSWRLGSHNVESQSEAGWLQLRGRGTSC